MPEKTRRSSALVRLAQRSAIDAQRHTFQSAASDIEARLQRLEKQSSVTTPEPARMPVAFATR